MVRFSAEALQVLHVANQEARNQRLLYVGTPHVLKMLIVLYTEKAHTILIKVGIDPDIIRSQLKILAEAEILEIKTDTLLPQTSGLQLVLSDAETYSFADTGSVEIEDLIISLLSIQKGPAWEILKSSFANSNLEDVTPLLTLRNKIAELPRIKRETLRIEAQLDNKSLIGRSDDRICQFNQIKAKLRTLPLEISSDDNFLDLLSERILNDQVSAQELLDLIRIEPTRESEKENCIPSFPFHLNTSLDTSSWSFDDFKR